VTRQRLTLHGLPTTTVTGPDVQSRTAGSGGSQQGSVSAIDSLAVPYADDDDDETTPATTPTSACPTPTSALPPPSTPSTPGPTAEQLYHMMLARTASSRRRRPGSRLSRRAHAGRMSQLESRFAVAERIRRARSPQPSAARLASGPAAERVPSGSAAGGHDSALPVSSSPSSVSLKHGDGLTPPLSARPRSRSGTGDKDMFKWSTSSGGGDRKLSSSSQLPNVVIDDSLMDAQVYTSLILVGYHARYLTSRYVTLCRTHSKTA